MSLLKIFQILRLFVNTLTPDDKNPLHNIENVLEPIQMQLSKKEKTFSEFSVSKSNFEHFEIKDDFDSLCISEITKRKRRV